MPASFNGIFGHKPSTQTVSIGGTFPEVHDQVEAMAGIGPMSRFAEDLRPTLKVLAGTKAAQLRLDEPVDMSKLKIFYQLDDGGYPFASRVEQDIRSAITQAVCHLCAICKLQPPFKTKIKSLFDSVDLWLNNVNIHDFALILNIREGSFSVITELTKWLFGRSHHTLSSICLIAQMSLKVSNPKAEANLTEKRDQLIEEFESMLGTDGVFLYPVHPTVAPFHSEPIIRMNNFGYTGIINVLGLPSTAVPMGLGRDKLPIGLQVIAGRNQDRLCLAVAEELERAFGGWIEPGTSY